VGVANVWSKFMEGGAGLVEGRTCLVEGGTFLVEGEAKSFYEMEDGIL